MKTFLASLYNTTKQIDPRTWTNLDATALRLVDLLENGKPKRQDVTYLRPSVLLYPAWFPTDRPDWRPFKVPKALPLDRSEVVIENQLSIYQLGFNANPKPMNVLECFKRLDVDGSDVKRRWIDVFLDSLQSTLEDRITDQHVVYFRSMRGNILRPIIESIKRSDDGSECVCRVVFVDAFAPPSLGNPSRMQLLANGLRLAVRTRLEVLDKYRGAMAKESSRLAQSKDPAEVLGKLHPLGGRILEIIRTIVLEAELQGSNFNAPPANLFHDGAKQATYERIRDEFKSWLVKLQAVTRQEDHEPEGKYIQTEQLLNELHDMHSEYIAIAAPTFLGMLAASYLKPEDTADPDKIIAAVKRGYQTLDLIHSHVRLCK